jgi:uncharacterized protein YvpB
MDFPEDQHGPCVKDLKQMDALNTNPAELCKAYAPTPQSVFDTMSPEELNIYTDRKLQYAYKNNNNLRNEGGNVMDALKLFFRKSKPAEQWQLQFAEIQKTWSFVKTVLWQWRLLLACVVQTIFLNPIQLLVIC